MKSRELVAPYLSAYRSWCEGWSVDVPQAWMKGVTRMGHPLLMSPSGALLEERKNGAWYLVRLGEHRRAGLNHDLMPRELDHLFCHVRVTDPAL